MAFVHLHAPHARPNESDACIVIHRDRLLVRSGQPETVTLPTASQTTDLNVVAARWIHLGLLEKQVVWLISLDGAEEASPQGLEWQDTRALLSLFTPGQSHAVSCARQLLWWDKRHRYCGVCGSPTSVVIEERARQCPQCHAVFFPAVFPAVIVAVTCGDELLLAHNRNFRPGMFSVLAGFLDPGETLEQAAEREVREEVGIQIADIEYVASQPWSFPNSLMLGFRARYVSGEITVDGKEIEEAHWFKRSALPDIPRRGTVARDLIDRWLAS